MDFSQGLIQWLKQCDQDLSVFLCFSSLVMALFLMAFHKIQSQDVCQQFPGQPPSRFKSGVGVEIKSAFLILSPLKPQI